MAKVIFDMGNIKPQLGDYCPPKQFHGLRSNGLIKVKHPHTGRTVTAKLASTPDEPGWVGYTGNKRAILGNYRLRRKRE